MDFKFNLIGPEIRLVMDTDEGVQYIEASAEQLHHERQAELLEEMAMAYASENGQGCLADRIAENMTPQAAESLINELKGRYHL